MPNTLTKDTESWLSTAILGSSGSPVLGLPVGDVNVFYKKDDTLEFTELTLVEVADPGDPQPGENFVHVGYGVYSFRFTATLLNVLGSFVWVAKKDPLSGTDFQQSVSIETINRGEDFIDVIDTIAIDLSDLTGTVTNGFSSVNSTLDEIQALLVSMNTKLDAIQATLTTIVGTIPDGITATYTSS